MGQAARNHGAARRAPALFLASEARSLCGLDQSASDADLRLHGLPPRAGECDELQVVLPLSQHAQAGARMARRTWLVQQPPLDLPDAAAAVRGIELPEVPPSGGRSRAERAVSRAACPEARRRLSLDPPVRLLRMPRDQRLVGARQADRPGHAAVAQLPRGGRGPLVRCRSGRARLHRGPLGRGCAFEPGRPPVAGSSPRDDRTRCGRG